MKLVQQKGFTLIELVIVVGIIGILSLISAIAFIDYVKRAHVAEGIELATQAKNAVLDTYFTQGEWPLNNSQAHLGAISSKAVASIAVNPNGVIKINYNKKVSNVAGCNITLIPDTTNMINGVVAWGCTYYGLKTGYIPAALARDCTLASN